MAALTLRVLGSFEIRGEAGRLLTLPTKKSQALFTYLALHPDRPCSRDMLTGLLWGDTPDSQARQSLRQALYHIRKTLGRARSRLVVDSGALTLRQAEIEVDALAFERRLRQATPQSLDAALVLYRGDLLEGLTIREAPFDEWLVVERERLRELALEGLARLLGHQMQIGATEVATQTGLRLLALDPLQEAAHRALMRLYDRQGRRAAALRQYEMCIGVLQRELHTEPEPATRQLYLEILRRQHPRPRRQGIGVIATTETPFVGRGAEVEQVHRDLTTAAHGRGRVVLVTGEAGIGKSRLVEEIAIEAQRRSWRLLVGRCHRTEQVLPFRPYIDALRASEALWDNEVLQRLAAPRMAELSRLFPELGSHAVPPAMSAEDHVHLLEAMSQLLRSLAARRPLMLVLEDLHWGDDMSLRLLGFLGRRIDNVAVFVVATFRDEELEDAPALRLVLEELDREAHVRRMSLGPLTEQATRQLVRALLGTRSAASGIEMVVTQTWAASRGNPLVVVESVREFQQRGECPTLPERVRELATAQVARLDEDSRHLLAVTAVAGEAVPFNVIAGAAGSDERNVANLVERLVRRRLLKAVGGNLDFTHDRIRQVVYEGLLPAYRQGLHAAVAKALEAFGSDRVDELDDRLAHHYALAGDLHAEVAATYLVRLSGREAHGYALDDAVKTLREALALVDRLPVAVGLPRRLEIIVQLAHILFFSGRIREAVDVLLGEESRVQAVDAAAVRGRYYAALGHAYWFVDEFERAADSAKRALDDAEQCGDGLTCGKAHYVLARARYWSGRPREGIRHGEAAVRLLEETAETWWLGQSYWVLALNYAHIGEFDRALDILPHVWRIATRTGDRRLQAYAEWTGGWIHVATGETAQGIEACRRAWELAPDTLHKASASGYLGAALLAGRDAPQAIAYLEAAVGQLECSGGFRYLLGYFTAVLAEAYLAMAQPVRARATAERALELARAARWLAGVGWAERALGRIILEKGDPAEAMAHFDTAIRAFEEVQARFQVARTRLLMAEAAVHGQQRHEDVARHLGAAIRIFTALRVAKYVARTERLAARLGVVPADARDVLDPDVRPVGD